MNSNYTSLEQSKAIAKYPELVKALGEAGAKWVLIDNEYKLQVGNPIKVYSKEIPSRIILKCSLCGTEFLSYNAVTGVQANYFECSCSYWECLEEEQGKIYKYPSKWKGFKVLNIYAYTFLELWNALPEWFREYFKILITSEDEVSLKGKKCDAYYYFIKLVKKYFPNWLTITVEILLYLAREELM